jgi:tetratricopeptide (TPR) repeat protein
MTAVPNPQPQRPFGLGRRLLLAALLLIVAVAAVGIILRFVGPSHVPPTPPEAKGDNLEPAVVTAIQAVRERVLQEPRSAKAWGDLGEVFLANELEAESGPCFAEAERLDPGNPRWPYFQAGPLLNRGDREAALPYLLRAVERCPDNDEGGAAIRLRLAETLMILGRFDEAGAHIRHVLDRQPQDDRANFDAALLAISRQDWEAARTHLLRCLGSPFARQSASAQLAAVCQRLGNADDADQFRGQADRLPKDLDWVDPFVDEYLLWAVKKRNRYRLAESLRAAKRYPEAVAVVRPMAAEYPDDYLPHLLLGQCLAQMGDYRGAEPALRQALRLAPDKVQTHYYLALLLFEEGEELSKQGDEGRTRAEVLFREAESSAREALAVKPDYGFALMALGLSLKHLGRRTEALTALRQAVRCNPEFADLHLRLAEMLAEDGQNAEARSGFEQALRLAPDASWRQDVQARLAALPKPPGR